MSCNKCKPCEYEIVLGGNMKKHMKVIQKRNLVEFDNHLIFHIMTYILIRYFWL